MFYLNKVYDYPQTKLQAIIPHYSKGAFCAPSAASNILKTFHADRVNQGEMIKTLASKEYMNTDPAIGTQPYDFMLGLQKYMNEYLGGYKSLSYQGIGNLGQFSTGENVPQIEWITDGLSMKKATWLIITLFKHNEENDVYTQVGGHLVTLVGYKVDARNNVLVIHDSASLEEEGSTSDFINLEKMKSGLLLLNDGIPAEGFLKVVDGANKDYATGEDYDTVVITGAIRLERK